MASTSTKISKSTDYFKGLSKKNSKNGMLKHSDESQIHLRPCRIKTEIDPNKVMHRYGINNCRKETVRFIADQLNMTGQSFELERLRTKMRKTINQKKVSSESSASSPLRKKYIKDDHETFPNFLIYSFLFPFKINVV